MATRLWITRCVDHLVPVVDVNHYRIGNRAFGRADLMAAFFQFPEDVIRNSLVDTHPTGARNRCRPVWIGVERVLMVECVKTRGGDSLFGEHPEFHMVEDHV